MTHANIKHNELFFVLRHALSANRVSSAINYFKECLENKNHIFFYALIMESILQTENSFYSF